MPNKIVSKKFIRELHTKLNKGNKYFNEKNYNEAKKCYEGILRNITDKELLSETEKGIRLGQLKIYTIYESSFCNVLKTEIELLNNSDNHNQAQNLEKAFKDCQKGIDSYADFKGKIEQIHADYEPENFQSFIQAVNKTLDELQTIFNEVKGVCAYNLIIQKLNFISQLASQMNNSNSSSNYVDVFRDSVQEIFALLPTVMNSSEQEFTSKKANNIEQILDTVYELLQAYQSKFNFDDDGEFAAVHYLILSKIYCDLNNLIGKNNPNENKIKQDELICTAHHANLKALQICNNFSKDDTYNIVQLVLRDANDLISKYNLCADNVLNNDPQLVLDKYEILIEYYKLASELSSTPNNKIFYQRKCLESINCYHKEIIEFDPSEISINTAKQLAEFQKVEIKMWFDNEFSSFFQSIAANQASFGESIHLLNADLSMMLNGLARALIQNHELYAKQGAMAFVARSMLFSAWDLGCLDAWEGLTLLEGTGQVQLTRLQKMIRKATHYHHGQRALKDGIQSPNASALVITQQAFEEFIDNITKDEIFLTHLAGTVADFLYKKNHLHEHTKGFAKSLVFSMLQLTSSKSVFQFNESYVENDYTARQVNQQLKTNTDTTYSYRVRLAKKVVLYEQAAKKKQALVFSQAARVSESPSRKRKAEASAEPNKKQRMC